MAKFGPLEAEICWRVWGTPANFSGFRILTSLLHGTLVVGVSQTLGVEQRALPIFGRAAIMLGIGPHSSYYYYYQWGHAGSKTLLQKILQFLNWGCWL